MKCLIGRKHSRTSIKIAEAIINNQLKKEVTDKSIICAINDIKKAMKQKDITCNWCWESIKSEKHTCTKCSERITKEQCSKNKGYCNKHK